MPLREQIALVRRAASDGLDVLHAPCLTAPLRLRCPLVVTIHDMIWFAPRQFAGHRESWTVRRRLMELYQRLVARAAARRAAAIITVSESARRGIVGALGVDAGRVTVTYEAANPAFRRLHDAGRVERVCRRHGVPPRFVLALGSADPRKNVPMLVEAYALLPEGLRACHPLVVVWTNTLFASDLASRVSHLGLNGQVRFLRDVTTEDLVGLYNAAAVFAHPSLQEGFGLPLVEAMATGTPVVALDNSSVPEVTGGAAVLCPGADAGSLAHALTRVLTDETLAEDLARRGVERAAAFSWDRCARETADVYARVVPAARGAGSAAGRETVMAGSDR
jgi:alpha-1,3-rhamnosyl/mannosyltransferase